MSILEIKDAMVVLTQSLPGVGQVWNRLRWLPVNATTQDVEAIFGVPDATTDRGWSVRAWMWYRYGRPAERLDLSGQIFSFTHHMVLQGYWEINDAYDSTTEWNVMCDLISRQFVSLEGLREVAERWTIPALLVEEELKAGGMYQCHAAEMHMDVIEIYNPFVLTSTMTI